MPSSGDHKQCNKCAMHMVNLSTLPDATQVEHARLLQLTHITNVKQEQGCISWQQQQQVNPVRVTQRIAFDLTMVVAYT